MKTTQGKITIGRYQNYSESKRYYIEIQSENKMLAIAHLDCKEFANAITGMGEVNCNLNIY